MSVLDHVFEFGWKRNARQHRGPPLDVTAAYALSIVEFDDQGWYHDPAQRDALLGHLRENEGRDLLVIVFVHGWRHNASASDRMLRSFRQLLGDAAWSEGQREAPRPVLGVYLSWRGLSLAGNVLWELSTFWARKDAAARVAVGSVREVLARLRTYQANKNEGRGEDASLAGTRLVLVGHSFGGLILFSAVAEYLIESLAAPKVVRPFGDLVILVNPAFEATRYQPILGAVLAHGPFDPNQRSCFVAVTATNDRATGWAFPLGRWLSTRFEAVRKIAGLPIPEDAQRQANLRTVGHLGWLTTHRLYGPREAASVDGDPRLGAGTPDPVQEQADFEAFNAEFRPDGHLRKNWRRSYASGAVMRHVGHGDPDSPFWIVEASKEIVDGHGGIFGDAFLGFLRQFCDDRLRPLRPTTGALDESSVGSGRPSAQARTDEARPSG